MKNLNEKEMELLDELLEDKKKQFLEELKQKNSVMLISGDIEEYLEDKLILERDFIIQEIQEGEFEELLGD